ncbi:MAG: hypothetical protein ACYDAO_02265 [Thermoplasmataceae archaeon]
MAFILIEIVQKGDFNDILNYYTNLFALKHMKEIEVFGFLLTYLGHSIILSADLEKYEYIQDFPNKEKGLDRVREISIDVKEQKNLENNFSCKISFDKIFLTGHVDKSLSSRFIEALDSSTFRFF